MTYTPSAGASSALPNACSFRDIRFDQRSSRFFAECACGWRSSAMTSAGLAHTAFDGHRTVVAS